MATTNTNKVMNNNGTTTLVCGNCGAELVIPNTSTFMVGMTMGKDSNLGTVVAPTVNHPHQHVPKITPEMLTNNPDLLNLVSSIMNAIDDGGFLDVQDPRIVKRWVVSQTLNMLNSDKSFQGELNWKGYDYSWEVVINDLKARYKLAENKDFKGLDERSVFYTGKVIQSMCNHYIDALEKQMWSMPQHKCKGREYIKLRTRRNYEGIFVKEFDEILNEFRVIADKVDSTLSTKTLYELATQFYGKVKGIRFRPNNTAKAFQNAYKAVGGYYTAKDLILFEGCRVDGLDLDDSLEVLDNYLKGVVKNGVQWDGYKMLGWLKQLIKDNNFDYETAKQNWAKQSDIRRAARKLNKNRRPRN